MSLTAAPDKEDGMGRRLIIFEKTSNKTPALTEESTNVQYPGAKAVVEAIAKVQAEADASYKKPKDGIPASDLTPELQESLENAANAYRKPQDGIPESDLSEGVQQSLDNANSAYQEPEGGIPKSDLSSAVQDSLDNADATVSGLAALESEVETKADKVSGCVSGDLASLDANGNLEDSGISKSAFQPGATSDDRYTKESFVNSSIATNTATFRGTYNLVFDLGLAVSATHEQTAAALAARLAELSIVPEHNDYCFVQVPTSNLTPAEISHVDRYKCNVSESGGTVTRTWAYEWSLNNSSFTAEQWAAINSGITASDVSKLAGIAAGAQVNVVEAVKVNGVQLSPDANKAVNVTVPTKAEDIEAAPESEVQEINTTLSARLDGTNVRLGNNASVSDGKVGSVSIGAGAACLNHHGTSLGGSSKAQGNGSTAIGYNASSMAGNAVQIGEGTNNTPGTLQFRGTVIVDANGKIVSVNLDTPMAAISDLFPAWAPDKHYSDTSVVSHSGALYKCTTEHTSGEEWDSAEAENWTETPLSGINVKPRQDPVSNPKADTATATTFVDTITQDENGVVKATRKPLGISTTATWSPTSGTGSTSQCLSQRGVLNFRQTVICKDWAANTAYKKGMFVLPRTSNPVGCFKCLDDHTSGASWNTTESEHWKSVTVADVLYALAEALDGKAPKTDHPPVETPTYDGENHYLANATDSTADIYGFDAIGTHNWTMARKGILYVRLASTSNNSSTVRIYVNEANQGHQILAMGMANDVVAVPLFLNADDIVILEISGNKLGYVQYSAFYTD